MFAWFIEDALTYWGISKNTWVKMPASEQAKMLRMWQANIGSKIDFVPLCNMKQAKQEEFNTPDFVAISLKTAEYFSCLSGQIPWGNQRRRAAACAELGEAMRDAKKISSSAECFQNSQWDITTKKK